MPYSRFDPKDMILRDYLALDRTILANERTLLSYLRTAIGLLAAGGTLLKLFPADRGLRMAGVALLGLGLIAGGVGAWRFIAVARKLSPVNLRRFRQEPRPGDEA